MCAGHIRPALNRPPLYMYRFSAGSLPSKTTRDSVTYSPLWNARHEQPRPFMIRQLHQVPVLTPRLDVTKVSRPGQVGCGLGRCLLARECVPAISDSFCRWRSSHPPVLVLPVPEPGWNGHLSSNDKRAFVRATSCTKLMGGLAVWDITFERSAMLQRRQDSLWVGRSLSPRSHHVLKAFRILGVAPSSSTNADLGAQQNTSPVVTDPSSFEQSLPTSALNT